MFMVIVMPWSVDEIYYQILIFPLLNEQYFETKQFVW